MSFIDKEVIKKHLQAGDAVTPFVFDQPVVLSGTDDSYLPNTNIDEDSEIVKIRLQNVDAVAGPVTLAGTVPAYFSDPLIVPGTVSVEAYDVAGQLFVEDADYILSTGPTASIARASTGSLMTDPQQVLAFYQPYTALSKNSDYVIDYSTGAIRRRDGSSIPDGARVFVDYSHSQGTTSDSMIDQAIEEAEAYVTARLSSVYSAYSTDQGIMSAATYYALSIIALSEAMKVLFGGRETAKDISKRWQELSAMYIPMAAKCAGQFATALDLPTAGALLNRYVANRSGTMLNPTISVTTRKR